ncbi:rod shape-determining protein RodA [Patescibacteria group bacterium]|nr:rod shape-determining protein RodA [Patescibacteria group bacterium]MDQ5919935.1 Rod shape-determining protein RodA [Patescibacteria group bacterium]
MLRHFLHKLERFDWILALSVLGLVVFGCLLLYSIGISQEQSSFIRLEKQLIAFVLGLIGAGTLCWMDYRQTRSFSVIGYLASFSLLLAVLLFGTRVNGTAGWFQFGSLSFQPVEIAKLGLLLYLAAFFSRRAHGRLSWKLFFLSGGAVSVFVGLVLLQPDFGSAMVMVGTWLALCVFIGLPRFAWIILPLGLALVGGLTWEFGLAPYQRDRILTFLDAERDARNSGYNAIQAQIAIGSGGLLGRGLGEGSQARLRFLPEASTDFIFSVLGEELGFAGVCLTILLYIIMMCRLLWIGYTSQDDYAALVLVGGSAMIFIHVFVNAGMNMGILPITGIPLPFLSAAASSLLSLLLFIGIAESIAIRRERHAIL